MRRRGSHVAWESCGEVLRWSGGVTSDHTARWRGIKVVKRRRLSEKKFNFEIRWYRADAFALFTQCALLRTVARHYKVLLVFDK